MARISKNVERDENGRPCGEVYVRRVAKEGPDKGKTYVGASTDMKHRDDNWYKKNSTSYAGKKINEARKTYSDLHNDWDTEILEKVYADTDEELARKLDEREDYWIDELNSIDNGFNAYKNSEREFSEDHCKHISENHRDYQTESTKEILREKGLNHVVTDETRQKISEGNTGKVRTDAQKAAQSARMKGVEPVAATEAAKKWVEENGSYWKNHPIPQEAKDKMKAAQQANGTAVIATYPDNTTHEFPTMLDAAKGATEFIGHKVNVGSVSNAIKSGGKTRDGFSFKKK